MKYDEEFWLEIFNKLPMKEAIEDFDWDSKEQIEFCNNNCVLGFWCNQKHLLICGEIKLGMSALAEKCRKEALDFETSNKL